MQEIQRLVGPGEIRDFRGAMVGRTDKGLFLTTGTFTPAAVKEATRDGAPAIDLIDGEAFAEQLKDLGLGVEKELPTALVILVPGVDQSCLRRGGIRMRLDPCHSTCEVMRKLGLRGCLIELFDSHVRPLPGLPEHRLLDTGRRSQPVITMGTTDEPVLRHSSPKCSASCAS